MNRTQMNDQAALAEASSDDTSFERLTELAHHRSREVRRAVALNGSSVSDSSDPARWRNLLFLSEFFPDDIAKNPMVLLGAYEAKEGDEESEGFFDFIAKVTVRIQEESSFELLASIDSVSIRDDVLRNSKVPERIIRGFYHAGGSLGPIAFNRSTPVDILEEILFAKRDFRFAKVAAKNPSLPSELIDRAIVVLTADVASVLTRNPRISECQVQLIYDRYKNDINVLEFIASGNAVPIEVQRSMVDDYAVREKLLENEAVSPVVVSEYFHGEVKGRLNYDRDAKKIARNPRTPPEILGEMAKKGDQNILYSLANNPSCEEDTLRTVLDRTGVESTLACAAVNPAMTRALFEKFLEKTGYSPNIVNAYIYTAGIVSNPSLPEDMLVDIFHHIMDSLKNPNAKSTKQNLWHHILSVTSHPSTPREIVEDIYRLWSTDPRLGGEDRDRSVLRQALLRLDQMDGLMPSLRR